MIEIRGERGYKNLGDEEDGVILQTCTFHLHACIFQVDYGVRMVHNCISHV